MRTRFMAEHPNDITFTLKIEAPASEFLDLRDELKRYGQRALPAPLTAQLTSEVDKLLGASRKVFHPADGDAPDVIGAFMGHAIYSDNTMTDDIKDELRRRIRGAEIG